MIVRTLDGLDDDKTVDGGTWVSRRMLLAGDGTNFSMHDTILHAGTRTDMWYRHHLEAVYCVGGEGWLIDKDNDEKHRIEKGTLYVLNGHEKHALIAETDLHMVCVFDPPVTGREVHDEDGAYPPPPSADDAAAK